MSLTVPVPGEVALGRGIGHIGQATIVIDPKGRLIIESVSGKRVPRDQGRLISGGG